MDKINQHIEKMLSYHDYVVVPQLGGFVVQKQSAVIHADRITPPFSTIGFNPLMKHADGLLAIEIARTEGITYRKAVELIESEVDTIKSRLTHTGIFKIENLGTIFKNETGNIQFTPVEKINFLPANLGLSELHISPRKAKTDDERRKVSFTLPKASTLRNAAAAVLFFALLGISQQVNDVKNTEYADLSSIAFANLPEVTVTPNACPELSKTESPTETTVVINDADLYHVVVASLPTQKSADRLCNSLKDEKYDCAHVLSPIKTYRVVIQSFNEKEEAIKFMLKLRESDKRFASAWVLCK
ncbi:MAG TPA: hypothetical protein P5084_13245 [Paludibacter sp.]|nr:hypothetical protein [Paludibacter sp.]